MGILSKLFSQRISVFLSAPANERPFPVLTHQDSSNIATGTAKLTIDPAVSEWFRRENGQLCKMNCMLELRGPFDDAKHPGTAKLEDLNQ